MAAFQDEAGQVLGIRLYGEVKLSYPALIEIVMILLAAWLSFKTTNSEIRRKTILPGAQLKRWLFCSSVFLLPCSRL